MEDTRDIWAKHGEQYVSECLNSVDGPNTYATTFYRDAAGILDAITRMQNLERDPGDCSVDDAPILGLLVRGWKLPERDRSVLRGGQRGVLGPARVALFLVALSFCVACAGQKHGEVESSGERLSFWFEDVDDLPPLMQRLGFRPDLKYPFSVAIPDNWIARASSVDGRRTLPLRLHPRCDSPCYDVRLYIRIFPKSSSESLRRYQAEFEQSGLALVAEPPFSYVDEMPAIHRRGAIMVDGTMHFDAEVPQPSLDLTTSEQVWRRHLVSLESGDAHYVCDYFVVANRSVFSRYLDEALSICASIERLASSSDAA